MALQRFTCLSIVAVLLVALVTPAAARFPVIIEPSIKEGELGYTADVGGNLTLRCRGDSNVTWYFPWMTIEEGKRPKEELTEEGGFYFADLQVTDLQYRHVGLYTCGYVPCVQGDPCEANDDDDDDYRKEFEANLYLFVKDENQLLTESGVQVMSVKYNQDFTIPCKPTFPGVSVTLTGADNKEILTAPDDIRENYHSDGNLATGMIRCTAQYKNHISEALFRINNLQQPSKPWITVEGSGVWQRDYDDVTLYDVLAGKDVTLKCSNPRSDGAPQWDFDETSMEGITVQEGKNHFEKLLQINNLEPAHSRLYKCRTLNHYYNSTPVVADLTVVGKVPHMEFLKPSNYSDLNLCNMVDINWVIPFKAYPLPNFTWIHDGEVVLNTSSTVTEVKHEKHEMIVTREEGFVLLQITGPTMKDIGYHELRAKQPAPGSLSADYKFHLIVTGAPESLSLVRQPTNEVVPHNSPVNITCEALGYPRPKLRLLYRKCLAVNDCEDYLTEPTLLKNITCDATHTAGCRHSLSETRVTWTVMADFSKKYICEASNDNGTTNSSSLLLAVSDQASSSGPSHALSLQVEVLNSQRRSPVLSFGGSSSHTSYQRYEAIGGQHILFTCQANKMLLYDGEGPSIIPWTNSPCKSRTNTTENTVNSTELSIFSTSTLNISDGHKTQTCYAAYRCVIPQDGDKPSRDVRVIIDVLERIPSSFNSSHPLNKQYYKSVHESLNLSCPAYGRPTPQVQWTKDGARVDNEAGRVHVDPDEHTLRFEYLKTSDTGTYTCLLVGAVGNDTTNLVVTDPEAYQKKILTYAVIGITVLLVICSIIIGVKLVMNHKKLRKEREFQRQLFLNGDVDNLNPELDITEQADLLPYNKKYEFPRDKIVFDKLLGSGAFGRVYRAKAKGILQEEEESTVAVKMIKSRSDHTHLKALRSEIKIMMHIGRHLNIVNLLGACSADMASKGELCLIVEYCRYGNILTYMRQKKGTFINQIGSDGRIVSAKYGSLTSRGSLLRNGYMNNDSNSTVIYRSGHRRRTMSQSKSPSEGQPKRRTSSKNSNNESPISPSVLRMDSVTSTQNGLQRSMQNSPPMSPTYSNEEVLSPAVHSPRPNGGTHQSFTFDTAPEMVRQHSESNQRELQQIRSPTRENSISRGSIGQDSRSNPHEPHQIRTPTREDSIPRGSISQHSGSNPHEPHQIRTLTRGSSIPRGSIGQDSGSNPHEPHQIRTPTREGTIPRGGIPQTQPPDDQSSLGNGSSSGNGRVRLGSTSNPATAATYQTSQGVGGYNEKPSFLSDMTQVTHDGESEAYITLGEDSMTTQRLLHWCYQIANGMEYLAARKVMHGDLAARNILLAEDGVVKISDFGMAKDIYKDDQYTKTSKVPIPIKWMAIEALRDGVLSTQSDVWSFGVVMWEIFTLGQIPYPTIEVNKNFVDQLEAGTRLNRPPYATNELYDVMKMCWEENPTSRPLFDKLADYLGNMMEVADKQFYMDLNQVNADLRRSNSSILNKMRSPDIRLLNNLDEDGYQMPKHDPMEAETSAQSFMSYRNIHGLSIQPPPTDEETTIEYLPMRSPTRVSGVNELPPTPGYYTQMSRSATPSRALRSPLSIRSISTSPTIYEERVFQFPSSAEKAFPKDDPQRYSQRGASNDSGFYTPSLVGNFCNPEYFMAPSQETEFTENAPMLNYSGRPSALQRQLSLKTEVGDQQREYYNVPLKPPRNRTTSETSSGLRSINEDPSRESLLQAMGSSYTIPEERHHRQECAV